MKIKTKITLGIGFLLLLILLLGLVGSRNINALKADTENILVANYNSLEYSGNMLKLLEHPVKDSVDSLDENLKKQEANITEPGEKETTTKLRHLFEKYRLNPTDSTAISSMKAQIFKIMDMNMKAIQHKSEVASKTAERANFWIAMTGSLCLLIAFAMMINLPASIANPIKALNDSIKKIASKKYSERISLESPNELGELIHSFNSMAEKLEEYNNSNLARLMMENRRIDALINSMVDPVIGLDENLKVLFVNEQALKITALSPNEIIGLHAQTLALKNDLIKLLIQDLIFGESLQKNSKPPAIKIFTDEKESYFEKTTIDLSMIPTGEKRKVSIGHVIILRNVTDYKELDSAKTNFIATVSHEFKTPISSIKLSSQLLENEKTGHLNTEQKNLVDSIKEDADRLLKITGELLNMTQIESGNIQLTLLPSDPKEMLLYAINAIKTQAEQRNIKFEINCPENIPAVLADNEKTAWVLTNLISNAIRYSYENSTIQLSISSENNKVNFKVKDTGQGIAPQYKEKIFTRYFRIPGTMKEGTGLGLSISKEFIEAQGGRITVDSELGKGSTFTLILNKAS